MTMFVIGNSGPPSESDPVGAVVLADDMPLAEVVAVQVPGIATAASRIILTLGPRDILDGFDESYVHARVVELLDAVRRRAPDAEIDVVGFPDIPSHVHIRDLCEASARAAARQRGMAWRRYPARR